jgi:outer membrane lipoprotein-sorting protein
MKNFKLTKGIFTLVILVFGLSATSFGQLTGRQIISKVYNRPAPNSQTANLTMTLINRNGEKRVREIKQYTRDFGNIDKKIMFFISPADVRNTSFMSWSYDSGNKDDDQWIYLPALKKVKRISSDSKSDYFMGSDFTYDDLGDRKVDDDTHKLLREEKVDGKNCYVVQSIPKDEDYMYSKTITWIDKSNFIGVKKDFYDEDGDLLKTLTIKKVQKFGKYLIITESVMKNVQKNHTTIIQLSNIHVNTNIPSSQFTERMMMRGL